MPPAAARPPSAWLRFTRMKTNPAIAANGGSGYSGMRNGRSNSGRCTLSTITPVTMNLAALPAVHDFAAQISSGAAAWVLTISGREPDPHSGSLAGALNSSSPVEVAGSGICNVNPTRRICRNELNGDSSRFNIAFVPKVVYVFTTGINKAHPLCVHVRPALGIVPFIVGHGPVCDDNQALPGMHVPASASARSPGIALHIHV